MSNQDQVSNQNDKVSNEVDNNQNIDKDKTETVDFKSHSKLLGQHKGLKEKFNETQKKLEELLSKEKEREESKMKETNQWKEIASKREQELEAERKKAQELERNLNDGIKLNAFVTSLPAKLKKESYLSFVDLDKIQLDENGNVDKDTLNHYKDEWVNEYGKDLLSVGGTKTFNGAPSNKGKLTIEQWKKLPLKERKEKMHLVVDK